MGLRDQWYENAIFYCLDVETYADSDGDGVGDFTGLTRRLDYLAGLGVTCLWLMPFYPSPNRDDGYDVTDYSAVDPRLGTMADFSEFVVEAQERGIHVIIDLAPNHTSDEHPWFQAARQDPESPYREYYVWRDDDPGDTSDQVVFLGEQQGIWTYDEQAKAYYLHHFYQFQPDLNFANPAVRDEFRKIMGLWLQLGVAGFRIDAAPFLINLVGVEGAGDMAPAHEYLQEMKDFTSVLFALPGAPMLFYGEEIGMGEQPVLAGRLSVRAPMQWTPYDNGGFSTAPPERFVRPVLAEGAFGFEQVSVAAQRNDPSSLLNWMATLICTRRECGEIGAGRRQVVDTGNDAILGLRYDDGDSAIVVLNNLSRDRHTIALDVTEREIATATGLFADRRYDPIDPKRKRVRIDGFGYRWLRLGGIY